MKISTILFALAICFVAAHTAASAQQSETRTLPSFNAIGIAGGFESVILKPGDTEQIVITSKGFKPESVETEVKNGKLNVDMKQGVRYDRGSATLVITYKSIKGLYASGSSDIRTEGTIKADDFEMAASGSGDFTGELDCNTLKVSISGSADFKLSGQAAQQKYAISGSGDIDASALKGTTAKAAVSGSGDIKLNISGNVDSAVSGSGDITNYHQD
jgi:Putative auto-transporter adhesin, head GIN domain